MDIITHAPLWVWPLLALLVWLGVLQLKDRNYSTPRVLVLPAVMVALSLTSTLTTFGARLDVLGPWVVALALIVVLNEAFMKWPGDVRVTADGASHIVPGSVVPLVFILVIFGLRFLTGATAAVAPAQLADPVFGPAVCGALGACSGVFLARALRILSSGPSDVTA